MICGRVRIRLNARATKGLTASVAASGLAGDDACGVSYRSTEYSVARVYGCAAVLPTFRALLLKAHTSLSLVVTTSVNLPNNYHPTCRLLSTAQRNNV